MSRDLDLVRRFYPKVLRERNQLRQYSRLLEEILRESYNYLPNRISDRIEALGIMKDPDEPPAFSRPIPSPPASD